MTTTEPGLRIGELSEDWSGDARFFEYSKAANPIGSGFTARMPIETFPADLHKGGATRVVPLDLSASLGIPDGPATSPALLASFIHIRATEKTSTAPIATSELYYILRGEGVSIVNGEVISWRAGDFITLPAGCRSTHHATSDTAMYWVTDEPLLRYLGVQPDRPKFRATKYDGETARAELDKALNAPRAADRSRISVLLANANQDQTLTITHVLWAMYGVVPARSAQRPHRHQSVALDLCADCPPGCYTLVGTHLDDEGEIVNPIRVDWAPGAAFTTPPGMWHAHYNEADGDAWIIPIQDAGLQTYLRSLDIRFAPPAPAVGHGEHR
ncbi:MAG TPA: cupin domain-containing protein [Acidimicrobiales bacterium]|nr:cupin domain-containing protein [Acidimicrobiales bacterium]